MVNIFFMIQAVRLICVFKFIFAAAGIVFVRFNAINFLIDGLNFFVKNACESKLFLKCAVK